jgi:hypothetical protein
MDTELMNAYVQKQNRLIGDLINKNLMLDSQLEIANKHIKELQSQLSDKKDKKTEEQTYK